jgi:hypothetical protein
MDAGTGGQSMTGPVMRGPMRMRHLRLGLAVGLLGATLLVPGTAAAAEYTMVTRAGYEVVIDEAPRVTVTVDINFVNRFKPPTGQVSVFRTIRVGIHDHAAAVTARDASGALKVTTAVTGGVNVATITPRSPIMYNKSAALTLAYELRDGDDPAIRVGPHLVSFPAWGFGTASDVRVELPSDYEVRVDGDDLEASVEKDTTVLTSGPISDPKHWLAHVGATREPAYETLQQAVPLSGGTADLQVRHWVDDPEWGQATLDLVVDALPLLEEAFGIPYPAQGPLVITESVSGGGPDGEAMNGEILVGFAEPPFTALHQVAHLWAGDAMGGDRWILEGLASWAAGRVSTELELALPYDPAAVAGDLADDAFPLSEWTDEDRSPQAERWAYASAWSLTNRVAEQADIDNFQAALLRMAAGLDGYVPLDEDALGLPVDPVPISSRAYLDHLDAVTDATVVETLAGPVLGDAAAAELEARSSARAAHDALLEVAGDWGDPDPVRAALVEWRFDEAQTATADAGEWLIGRDALLAEIGAAGLTAPVRLRDAYRVHGGGLESWAEIDAERAVVDAYVDVEAALSQADPVGRVGLLIGPSPEERLATAASAFAAGDLRVSADELTSLGQDLATATAGGLARMLGLGVAIGAGVLLATYALRRRGPGKGLETGKSTKRGAGTETGTVYTPEP